MSKISDVINSLPELLPLKPASTTQITDAELQLRVSFSEEYKDYLSAFGAIIADGIELSGIAKSDYRNVVFLTKREWELNSKVPHTMYVVEDTHIDGIIIWQDSNGKVFQTMPNSLPHQIADSLAVYILMKLKEEVDMKEDGGFIRLSETLQELKAWERNNDDEVSVDNRRKHLELSISYLRASEMCNRYIGEHQSIKEVKELFLRKAENDHESVEKLLEQLNSIAQ